MTSKEFGSKKIAPRIAGHREGHVREAATDLRQEKKEANIDASATERIFRMSAVTKLANEVFANEALAIEWMRKSNQSLENVAPLDLMDTEPGAVSVRRVLYTIASGGVA